MPSLTTPETTGASEEVVNLDQLWATTAFVRPASRLVSPASVETITLQLQSDLPVVCRATALASLLGRKSQIVPGLTLAPALLATSRALARPLSALLEILQHTSQLRLFQRWVLGDARHVDPPTIVVLEFVILTVVSIVVDGVVVVNVAVLGHIGAVIPLIVVRRERRGNLTHGSPGQNLDSLEEIGEVPRTVGLGHDVVFQVPWDLGLPEEDHALRQVRQRVTVGVMLQKGSAGHIRELK